VVSPAASVLDAMAYDHAMGDPIVFGAAYSVYVRIVRLVLAEKRVAYRLHEVDVFARGGPPPEHLARQPFGRIPAFEHEGFALYETTAIARYIDEAFDGPPLQPEAPRPRARMNQIVAMLDGHGYRPLVWDLYMERVDAPRSGRVPDEARIATGAAQAGRCLDELVRLMGEQEYLAGDALTLADLHAAPMLAYALAAREGAALVQARPALARWWQRIASRSSMAATRPSPNPVA
jgi:glutathione S-transferase